MWARHAKQKGGDVYIHENDHAFGYIKTLSDTFWKINKLEYYKAEGMDIYGADTEEKLVEVFRQMDAEI